MDNKTAIILTNYEKSSAYTLRVDTIVWGTDFKSVKTEHSLFKQNKKNTQFNYLPLGGRSLLVAYTPKSSSSSSDKAEGDDDAKYLLCKFSIDDDANLKCDSDKAMTNYFYDKSDDTIGAIFGFLYTDSDKNQHIYYPGAEVKFDEDFKTIKDIKQYLSKFIAPPLKFPNNETQILVSPYGLGYFNKEELDSFIVFSLTGFYYQAINDTYYFINEDNSCALASVNIPKDEYKPFYYSETSCKCEMENSKAIITGVIPPSGNAKPTFSYSCSTTNYATDDIFIVAPKKDGDSKDTVSISRGDGLTFMSSDVSNVTVLGLKYDSTHQFFKFTNYLVGDINPTDVDIDIKKASAVNKVDEYTFISATPKEDGDSSTVSVRDVNGTYYFNQTIGVKEVKTIIPMAYSPEVESKILGFMVIDDKSLYFYNVEEKEKVLIGDKFEYANYAYRYAGNGTAFYNDTTGLKRITFVNVDNVGLSAGILSVATALLSFVMMLVMF